MINVILQEYKPYIVSLSGGGLFKCPTCKKTMSYAQTTKHESGMLLCGFCVQSSTQDKAAEVAFFDSVAQSRPIYSTDANRPSTVVKLLGLDRDLTGLKVLEVGCATGEYGSMLVQRGATVYGVDISPEMIRRNYELHPVNPNYSRKVGDIERRELYPHEEFDIVLSVGVLHHFPDPARVIGNMAYWLKSGGLFLVFEPNGGHLVNRLFKAGRSMVQTCLPTMLTNHLLASENESASHTMKLYKKILHKNGMVVILHGTTSILNIIPDEDWVVRIISRIRCVLSAFSPQGDHLYVSACK